MEDFSALCLKRESCRDYKVKEVDEEIIKEILKDALNAPSACNSQPWHFYSVSKDNAKAFRKFIGDGLGIINGFCKNVQNFIVIAETPAKLKPGVLGDKQKFAQMDIGEATAYLTLSAKSKGVDSCIMGLFSEEKIKKSLEIPEEYKVRIVVALGYGVKEEPRPKQRKDFFEKVTLK